jgi:hypothetical protein
MPGVTRGIEWIRCSVVMWHDVIWVEMTCQLDTWHDADLTWMTGSGHGARIRGDDRWYLSRAVEKENLIKASRWWKSRNEILCEGRAHTKSSLSSVHSSIRKRVLSKAMTGRGRPQSPWIRNFYSKLLSEFERLSKAGLKFSNAVLGELARGLIISETENEYNGIYKDADGKRIVEKITTSWIQ